MKNQLSIQEKLWDLRRDHDYKLEEVAAAVNVVPATISKYENKENKEYNIVTLNKLADFYGVSLEWLVGNTEVRTSSLTEIDNLMLDDETIELLKSGRFNNKLLCEIIKHPDFLKLMADTEIYVDGIATMQIKNMNDWLDTVRLQIIQQKNPDANDLYLKVHIFRKKNISSIPFTAIGTILSAPFVRTTNTLPNLPLSKDQCLTTKRCSVSCRHSSLRATLLRNSGASSAMKCRFHLTIFPWMNIRL